MGYGIKTELVLCYWTAELYHFFPALTTGASLLYSWRGTPREIVQIERTGSGLTGRMVAEVL